MTPVTATSNQLVGGVFRLASQDDQNASAPNKITYTYNTSGVLTTINDTIGGRPVTFTYGDPNNAEQPSQIHDDALSRDIYLEYSGPNGAMSKITDATGAVMSFGYGGANNQITTITDDAGTVTTLAYTPLFTTLSQVTYATGKTEQSVWQYVYASSQVEGFLGYVKDPNLNTTRYRSFSPNQVVEIMDPLGHLNNFTVDGHDNITSAQAALGNTTTYTYNANNSLTPGNPGVPEQHQMHRLRVRQQQPPHHHQLPERGEEHHRLRRRLPDHLDHGDQHLQHCPDEACLYLHRERHQGRGPAEDPDHRDRGGHDVRV
ncbi:hypothetical protein AB6813_14460 [bacterium RCC_150]